MYEFLCFTFTAVTLLQGSHFCFLINTVIILREIICSGSQRVLIIISFNFHLVALHFFVCWILKLLFILNYFFCILILIKILEKDVVIWSIAQLKVNVKLGCMMHVRLTAFAVFDLQYPFVSALQASLATRSLSRPDYQYRLWSECCSGLPEFDFLVVTNYQSIIKLALVMKVLSTVRNNAEKKLILVGLP